MDDIPKFTSQEWYRVKGRGWCAVVRCDKERHRNKHGFNVVEINGELFNVIGVDRSALGGPIRSGELIGLLVRERGDAKPNLPLPEQRE